jgi:hypothetical protein
METYAFIRNGIVLLVDTINEEDYINHIREWDAIIKVDTSVMNPRPGWILFGNEQIFGNNLALELVNMVGTINLTLSSQGQIVDVATLLSNLMSVKMLLETGALKTARGLCAFYKPRFTVYSNVFQYAIDEITKYLQAKGWD